MAGGGGKMKEVGMNYVNTSEHQVTLESNLLVWLRVGWVGVLLETEIHENSLEKL